MPHGERLVSDSSRALYRWGSSVSPNSPGRPTPSIVNNSDDIRGRTAPGIRDFERAWDEIHEPNATQSDVKDFDSARSRRNASFNSSAGALTLSVRSYMMAAFNRTPTAGSSFDAPPESVTRFWPCPRAWLLAAAVKSTVVANENLTAAARSGAAG